MKPLAQAERQRHVTLAIKRWAYGPFCACCPARHAVVARLARTLCRRISRLVCGKVISRCLRFGSCVGFDQTVRQGSSRQVAAQASPARRVLLSSGIGFSDDSNETCGKVAFATSHRQRHFRSSCLTIHSSGQTNRCAFGLPLSSGVRTSFI